MTVLGFLSLVEVMCANEYPFTTVCMLHFFIVGTNVKILQDNNEQLLTQQTTAYFYCFSVFVSFAYFFPEITPA